MRAIARGRLLVLAASLVATSTCIPSSAADQSALRVATLASRPGPIGAFAQQGDVIAWTEWGPRRSGCERLRFATMRSKIASLAPRLVAHCSQFSSAEEVYLAKGSAFFVASGASNLTAYLQMWAASPRDKRFRHRDDQVIDTATYDVSVPPAADGGSLYFWSSPEGVFRGPLVRYDGVRRTRVTGVLDGPRALAAGDGRFAFARAEWTLACARDPAWAPDGAQLAYASYATGLRSLARERCAGGIWLVEPDGRNPRRIAGSGQSPDWSPDGASIVYADDGTIVVARRDGREPLPVARGAHPAWSPDGGRLVYDRDGDVYSARIDGSGERMVVRGGVDPDWSPGGDRIVFARADGLSIVRADGSELRSLTTGNDSDPAWSPDGRTIAFTRCGSGNCFDPVSPGLADIATIAPDGTDLRAGPGSDEFSDMTPSWAPDSTRLAWAREPFYYDNRDVHVWTPEGDATPRASVTTPVFVRSRTGRLLARYEPSTPVIRLAVTGRVTAAVVQEGRSFGVDILAPVRRLILLAWRPTAFAASQSTLLLGRGRDVYVVDAGGDPRLVARAGARPIGLSIVGRRIAWAENVRGHGRVRAVFLR